MPTATLHRLPDDRVPQALALLAAAGITPRTIENWRHDHMTALVLGEPEDPAALMPLARRTLRVAPGRSIRVGWLSANMFASKMSLRRQTRPTASQWPELLPELDALVAVRKDEPSSAARWYEDTGFHPVLPVRCHYLQMTEPPRAPVGRYRTAVVAPAELGPWQPHLLAVYQNVFANYGGPVVRGENHWVPALEHHFYRDHYQFQIVGLWQGSPPTEATAASAPPTLMGYAVVGWSGWHSKQPRMDILELATRQWDAAVALELIQTTAQLAWSKNVRQVRAVLSVHDPYRPHLIKSGFEDRWGYHLMAKFLNPQRYLAGLAPAAAELFPGVSLELATPGSVPLSLAALSPSAPVVRLQTSAQHLTRLLLQRLDLAAALHDGSLIPTQSAPQIDLTRLSLLLPWTPWLFHMLDFI